MGILIAKKYTSQEFPQLVDYTYVESGPGENSWACWSRKDNGIAFQGGPGSTAQAAAIADLDEHAGIASYLVNGICHQAANRILYPARLLVTGARGYGLSEALFGPYGRPRGFPGFRSAPFHQHEHVSENLDEPASGSATLNGFQVAFDPRERAYVRQVADMYNQPLARALQDAEPRQPKKLLRLISEFQEALFKLMIDYRLNSTLTGDYRISALLEARMEVESNRFEIERAFAMSEIHVDVFVNALNEEFIAFQMAAANILNAETYQRLFDTKPDELVWLGSPSIARKAYNEPETLT